MKNSPQLTRHSLDFYAWTQEQAQLLRNQQFQNLDWGNIAEELEDIGRSEKRALGSRLEVLIMHLLKWQFQPSLRSRSWELTLKEQRLRIERLLAENPSLKSNLAEIVEKVYPLASLSAEKETGLSSFPETCPYSLQEMLNLAFFPDSGEL